MSNIDKQALREVAEKATPGRWEYYPGNTGIEYNVDSMDEDQGSIVYVDSGDFTQKQTDLNGAFIAAVNPTTVLALLDELEAKDKLIAELEAREVKLPKPISVLHRRDFMDAHRSIYAYPEAEVNAALSDAGIRIHGED